MRIRINYSIIFVSDMDRSVAFYRDIVGIPLKFTSPNWTEFATEGATMALHKAASVLHENEKADSEAAGQCRAGFQVPNLDEFHDRMVKSNVQCVQEPTATFGVKIANYVDPDGMIFSVSGARAVQQETK